jgi:hypothetical protein
VRIKHASAACHQRLLRNVFIDIIFVVIVFMGINRGWGKTGIPALLTGAAFAPKGICCQMFITFVTR